MATTPNYGWVTPAPTDFVTDLPADFETFADAVDDTVKDLNPGTTAGDLDYYTSSTAKARLGIGTANQVLAVNSGATAPEWKTISSGGMTVIASGSLSGTAVNITSIPNTYKNLQLVIRDFLPTNDNSSLILRVNNDSNTRYENTTSNSAPVDNTPFNLTFWRLSPANDNGVANGLCIANIYDYANTTSWKMAQILGISVDRTTTTNFRWLNNLSFYDQTGAINELNIISDGGNMTGSYILYGVS